MHTKVAARIIARRLLNGEFTVNKTASVGSMLQAAKGLPGAAYAGAKGVAKKVPGAVPAVRHIKRNPLPYAAGASALGGGALGALLGNSAGYNSGVADAEAAATAAKPQGLAGWAQGNPLLASGAAAGGGALLALLIQALANRNN